MKFTRNLLALLFSVLLIAQVHLALASQADSQIGAAQTGLAYRTADNAGKKAILNHHKGSSAPSYAEAGMIWIDDTTTPWKVKAYDGADWIVMGELNATNNTWQPYNGTATDRLLLYATDTGAANAYAIAPAPAITAYATGQLTTLKVAHANTAASTLNTNSLGTKNIKLLDGTDPSANAMVTTGVYLLFYDGTNQVLLNPSVGAGIAAIANGGTANSTAAGARGSTGLNIDQETTHGDSIYSIAATDRTVATSASLTASRAWTLPAANAVNAGQKTCIMDQAGGVTNTNTIVITRAGSDTIDGGTTYTLNAAYQGVCLISDGSSKWSSRKIPDAALPSLSASQLLGKGATGGDAAIALGTNLYMSSTTLKLGREYCVALSDQTTALTTGTANGTLYLPAAATVNSVRAYVVTAPTGAAIKVDVKGAGTTILSTKIQIDISGFTSLASGTPPVISNTSIASNAAVTFDISQVGSTIAGAGLVGCIDVTF